MEGSPKERGPRCPLGSVSLPSPLWVCFLLLGVFPWLAPRTLQPRGAWDGLGVRGAQGPGRAKAAEGWGGHDPDNPLCLTVTTKPARTRVAAAVFAREGERLQWGGNKGCRRREAGRAGGSLLLAMTLTPSFLLPAFEFALFPSQHSSPLPLPPPPPPSLGYLPSRWRCKTGPRHLHRCRDVLPQITGPARQPLGSLQPPSAHQYSDPPSLPPVPRTRPRSLDAVTPIRAGRSGEDSWGHPRSGPGARACFRYLQEIAGCGCLRSPPPPGLHYYYFFL